MWRARGCVRGGTVDSDAIRHDNGRAPPAGEAAAVAARIGRLTMRFVSSQDPGGTAARVTRGGLMAAGLGILGAAVLVYVLVVLRDENCGAGRPLARPRGTAGVVPPV